MLQCPCWRKRSFLLLYEANSGLQDHMHFVRITEASQGQLNTSPRENNPKKRCGVLPISQPGPSKMPKVATSYFIPKSLSVVEMPKLGKTIKKTSTSSQLKTSTCRQWFGHVPDLLKQSIINPLPKEFNLTWDLSLWHAPLQRSVNYLHAKW